MKRPYGVTVQWESAVIPWPAACGLWLVVCGWWRPPWESTKKRCDASMRKQVTTERGLSKRNMMRQRQRFVHTIHAIRIEWHDRVCVLSCSVLRFSARPPTTTTRGQHNYFVAVILCDRLLVDSSLSLHYSRLEFDSESTKWSRAP